MSPPTERRNSNTVRWGVFGLATLLLVAVFEADHTAVELNDTTASQLTPIPVDAEIEAMVQDEIERQLPSAPTSALRKLLKPAMLEEEEARFEQDGRPERVPLEERARAAPTNSVMRMPMHEAREQLDREKHSHARWCQPVTLGERLPSTSSGHEQDHLFKSAGKVGCVSPETDLHAGDNLAHVLRVRSFRREIILMVTDGNTIDQAVNMVLNLRVLGLEHYLLITFDVELCRTLDAIIPDLGGCVWTSLPVPQLGGSFEMWTMRKHYLGVMAGMEYNVFQTDLDVLWLGNPYPVLKGLLGEHNLILQREVGDGVNGGVIYVQNAHPQGPAVWALQELSRRVLRMFADPVAETQRRSATLFAGLLKQHPDRKELVQRMKSLTKAMSDEQDLLNDVLFTVALNQTVHYHSTRGTFMETISREHADDHKGAQRAKEAWIQKHEHRMPWHSSDSLQEDHPKIIPKEELDLLIPTNMCSMPPKGGSIDFRPIHVNGQPAHISETAVRAATWVFGTAVAGVYYTQQKCSVEETPPRTRWSERPSKLEALVWHLVGTGGGYESRKKVMRAWGAWHYPLVDSLPDPLHFFPMDNSRVLAFDQRAAAALSFASVENLVTAVRRLAMLAAAAGRTAVHPLVDCECVYQPDTSPPRAREGWYVVPRPGNPPSHVCISFGGRDSLAECTRDELIYPPEFEFMTEHLEPTDVATVKLATLFSQNDPSETVAGDGATEGNQRTWHADEWRQAEGVAGVGDTLALSAGSVKRLLALRDQPVVYLTMDGLDTGDGDALLRQLPHSLTNVDVFTGNDLLALSCTEFFPSPKSHPKTRRTHVLEAKMLHPLPAHERIMGRYNGGNPHV